MAGFRIQRFSDEVKKIISEIFINELSGDDLGFVTVTKVKCSPDLQEAKVYISVYENDENKRTIKFKKIIKKVSKIRGFLGHKLKARHVPNLRFYEDDSLQYAEKIEKLIQKMHKEEEENDK